MDLLPCEILDHIFSFLPEFNIPHRLVCVTWFSFPSKENFPLIISIGSRGHITLLKWLWENRFMDPRKHCYYLSTEAARYGHIDLLEWLTETPFPEKKIKIGRYLSTVCLFNQRKVIEWSHKKGYLKKNESDYFSEAAFAGNKELIIWLREKGYLWDESTCAGAARGGHLELLKWLYENGCPWDDRTMCYSIGKGKLEMLKWIHEHGCPLYSIVMEKAADYEDNIPVLSYLKEIGCTGGNAAFGNAAIHGNIKNMEWFRDNGYRFSTYTTIDAVRGGKLTSLKWLIENGCPYEKWNLKVIAFKRDKELQEYIDNLP